LFQEIKTKRNAMQLLKNELTQIFDQLFAISPDIRYAAIYRANQLDLMQRPELQNASSSESDKYEELIVNPTLLTLVKQRGQIDCGGMEYVLIRYGNFFQLVHPIAGGHLSVAIEPRAQPLDLLDRIRQALVENGFEIDAP
jgi:hypothetical protein